MRANVLSYLRWRRAGFDVTIDGGMGEVARLAQLQDVPLSGLLRDVKRSGGFEVGCAVKGIRKGF